ncbi:LysR family transcriptional regulator [Amycolatopsis sp. cg5]|uniref:LysR family transcriptional regulator n=1 Tax=Amycolatopsis sp. cg5 TaxID=3238802 RepID=UPI00352490AD
MTAEPSFHQLRLLLTLAEELHFGRAAARLFITQPALSQQIGALEKRLSLKLIDRTTRRVALTDAGHALLLEAKEVINAMDRLLTQAGRRRHSGKVVIGMLEGALGLTSTRAVLKAVRNHCPDFTFDVRVLDLVGQHRCLETGEVDALFGYLPAKAGVTSLPFAHEPRLACVSRAARLASSPELTLAELSREAVVGVSREVPRTWREFWAADPRPDGAAVRYTGHGVTSLEAMLTIVALGEGIAFVPAGVRDLYPRPDVRYLPVLDMWPCTPALLWPEGAGDLPGVADLRIAAAQVAV